MNDRVEEQSEVAFQKQMQARTAINLWAGSQPQSLFKTGDRVWLEGKNLKLPYQSLKLAPKLVLLTAEPLIFALFAVWYQEKFGKI